MSNDHHPFSDLPLLCFHVYDWKDESIAAEDVSKMMRNSALTNKTFIPQNIYKVICKFALSLMPHLVAYTIKKPLNGFKVILLNLSFRVLN